MREDVLFSSKSDEWNTPDWLFEQLDSEFHFTLDPCSDIDNHKCSRFFTAEDDGLKQEWGGERVFCNPPYSRISDWVKKCYTESLKPNTVVVMLIPARTDTKYFHQYILHRAEIRFIAGRLKFSGHKYNAPFPSMLVIYRAGGLVA